MDEIVYNWNFHPLEVVYNEDTLTNVVNVVHWQYVAKHVPTDVMIQNIGTVGLETPAPETFIPFESLTKETVTEWVETKLGQEMIANMQTSLSASLNDKLNPTRGPVNAPWEVTPSPSGSAP